MTLKLLLTISLVFLAGCTKERVQREVPPQIITKWKTYDCGIPPQIDKIDFKPVVWDIIDEKYTLTTDMYANLGDNMSMITQASKQTIKLIGFYQACIDAAQEKSDE